MIDSMKRLAGGVVVLTGMALGGSLAHGQDLGYDVQQYQRDQWQAQRDYNQLNRDIATGNVWGVQRDVNNLQQDRRDLYQDRRNIQQDVLYPTQPYSPGYGGCGTPSYPQPYGNYPSPLPYGGPVYGGGYSPASVGVGVSFGRFNVGVGPAPVFRPW
jgi:hypothetical protein